MLEQVYQLSSLPKFAIYQIGKGEPWKYFMQKSHTRRLDIEILFWLWKVRWTAKKLLHLAQHPILILDKCLYLDSLLPRSGFFPRERLTFSLYGWILE